MSLPKENKATAEGLFWLCPDLPIQQKPGYLEFLKCVFFVFFDFALSISFGIEQQIIRDRKNLMQKKNTSAFHESYCYDAYVSNHFRLLGHIFSNQTLEQPLVNRPVTVNFEP